MSNENLTEMTAAELKLIATEKGLPFETNYGQKKMLEVLGVTEQEGPDEKSAPDVAAGANSIKREWQAICTAFSSRTDVTSKEGKDLLRREFLKRTEGIKKKLRDLGADDVLADVLRFEKIRNMLPPGQEYKLNAIDASKCDLMCRCAKEPKAAGLFLQLNGEYPYSVQFSEERGVDVFTVFVTRIIEPEEQIGKELEWKIKNGFMPEQKDYPEAKKQVRRLTIVRREFEKYFEAGVEESEALF